MEIVFGALFSYLRFFFSRSFLKSFHRKFRSLLTMISPLFKICANARGRSINIQIKASARLRLSVGEFSQSKGDGGGGGGL